MALLVLAGCVADGSEPLNPAYTAHRGDHLTAAIGQTEGMAQGVWAQGVW